MDKAYLQLIRSKRVSAPTRRVLLQRLRRSGNDSRSKFLDKEHFALLEAVVERLIPQAEGGHPVEIASLLDAQHHRSAGDGWRFANMPPDGMALELGLTLIDAMSRLEHGSPFALLDSTRQDALLRQVASGEARWTALDSRHWFEDVLAQSTEIYVSHPAILAKMGFSGIAFLPKWPRVGLHTTQEWEPSPR